MEELQRLIDVEAPDVERLALAFDHVCARYIAQGDKEIDLARAMGDREARVKAQIKIESLKHARRIFADCYLLVTGSRAWDE